MENQGKQTMENIGRRLLIMLQEESNGTNHVDQEEDDSYFDSLPPGYRFCPTDEELVVHYLAKKLSGETLPKNRIRNVNIYSYTPQQLSEIYKLHREQKWYFFTSRDKKYPNGSRPNREVPGGYWKATGADIPILSDKKIIGYQKPLVFCEGNPRFGVKSNWLMQEYTLVKNQSTSTSKATPNDMKLDFVLCKVYQNSRVSGTKKQQHEEEESHEELPNADQQQLQFPNLDQQEAQHIRELPNTHLYQQQVQQFINPNQQQPQHIRELPNVYPYQQLINPDQQPQHIQELPNTYQQQFPISDQQQPRYIQLSNAYQQQPPPQYVQDFPNLNPLQVPQYFQSLWPETAYNNYNYGMMASTISVESNYAYGYGVQVTDKDPCLNGYDECKPNLLNNSMFGDGIEDMPRHT